ncbi:DUF3710 domain-containing protein [Gordonia jinhuaensis]|uniref:DUF3710 domain-containing protein n=1 Tax=Gordonia jinhuaensis TaxID=1517702 RepID=A0A916T0M0_9ACTN|nr:DUF3710 domain-containing protein [Gordonia jinhuaensis]GGB25690.1 hypothetical protein GCM10011489_12320 [Gordonia jinhuaensis]
MARRDDHTQTPESAPAQIGQGLGPYDIADFGSDPDLENSHLDLGSVLVPVVEGGQVTVEMSPDHQPQGVFLVTPYGRINVAAFAAPRSPGLWREVVKELSESLRNDGATVTTSDGHWGREVDAEIAGGRHHFIGVDGPRWLVRCVASGPVESSEQLIPIARAVLSESVVRRGTEPAPPREPLPVVLPPVLAEQVAAAQQQMMEQAASGEGPNPFVEGAVAIDENGEVSDGSAMRQLRDQQGGDR